MSQRREQRRLKPCAGDDGLYHELTSAEMLVPVDGHLALLCSLLEAPTPDKLRRRIAYAAGEAAGFAAWIWFDLGDHFAMGHRYATALDALGEAGDGIGWRPGNPGSLANWMTSSDHCKSESYPR